MEYITFIAVPTSPIPFRATATYFHFKDAGKDRYFVTDLPINARWGDAPYGFDNIEDWAVEIPDCMGKVVFSGEFKKEFSRIALNRAAKNNPRPPETIMEWAKRTGIIKA
jgi:hypothetical protein